MPEPLKPSPALAPPKPFTPAEHLPPARQEDLRSLHRMRIGAHARVVEGVFADVATHVGFAGGHDLAQLASAEDSRPHSPRAALDLLALHIRKNWREPPNGDAHFVARLDALRRGLAAVRQHAEKKFPADRADAERKFLDELAELEKRAGEAHRLANIHLG